jgi:hypothetical protein
VGAFVFGEGALDRLIKRWGVGVKSEVVFWRCFSREGGGFDKLNRRWLMCAWGRGHLVY